MARKLKLDATLMNPTDKKWSLAQSISREESMSFVRPIDYLSFSYIIVLYILDNEMVLQNIGLEKNINHVNKSLGQLAMIRGVSIKLTMKWKGQGVF